MRFAQARILGGERAARRGEPSKRFSGVL